MRWKTKILAENDFGKVGTLHCSEKCGKLLDFPEKFSNFDLFKQFSKFFLLTWLFRTFFDFPEVLLTFLKIFRLYRSFSDLFRQLAKDFRFLRSFRDFNGILLKKPSEKSVDFPLKSRKLLKSGKFFRKSSRNVSKTTKNSSKK